MPTRDIEPARNVSTSPLRGRGRTSARGLPRPTALPRFPRAKKRDLSAKKPSVASGDGLHLNAHRGTTEAEAEQGEEASQDKGGRKLRSSKKNVGVEKGPERVAKEGGTLGGDHGDRAGGSAAVTAAAARKTGGSNQARKFEMGKGTGDGSPSPKRSRLEVVLPSRK
jgi:hypothetical protein